MYDNVQFAMNDLDNQFWKERGEKWNTIQKELGMTGLSWWNYSGGNDGTEIMTSGMKEAYEFHRRLNSWKEPARIDYADKKWAIQKKYLDDLLYQEKVREYLSWLSPVGIFEQITELQCRTNPAIFLRYLEHVRAYRESVIRYFKDKKLFETFIYFTPVPESFFMDDEKLNAARTTDAKELYHNNYPTLNLDDVPVFEYKGATVASSMNDSLGRMAGLLVLCIILLGATVVSFIKYDVR